MFPRFSVKMLTRKFQLRNLKFRKNVRHLNNHLTQQKMFIVISVSHSEYLIIHYFGMLYEPIAISSFKGNTKLKSFQTVKKLCNLFLGCARFLKFVQNVSERQILWSLCSVDFDTLTLQLSIQTLYSVAPELQVFVSSLQNCQNFSKMSTPQISNIVCWSGYFGTK